MLCGFFSGGVGTYGLAGGLRRSLKAPFFASVSAPVFPPFAYGPIPEESGIKKKEKEEAKRVACLAFEKLPGKKTYLIFFPCLSGEGVGYG